MSRTNNKHGRFVRLDRLRVGLAASLATLLIMCFVGTARAEDSQAADALLASGEYAKAMSAYQVLTSADKNNVQALLGLARSQSALKQKAPATSTAERALKQSPREHAVVQTVALVLFDAGNTGRATKLVRDHIASDLKNVDQQMYDTLRYLIESVRDASQKGRAHADAVVTLDNARRALEAKRPGEKLWGAVWLSTETVEEMTAANAKLQKKIIALDEAIRGDMSVFKGYEADVRRINKRSASGADDDDILHQRRSAMRKIDEEIREKQSEIKAINAQMTLPEAPAQPGFIAYGSSASAPGAVDSAPSAPTPAQDESATHTPPTVLHDKDDEDDVPKPRPPLIVLPPDEPASVDVNDPNMGGDATAKNPGTDPATDPVPPSALERTVRHGVAFAVASDLIVAPFTVVDGATDIVVQAASGQTDTVTVVHVDAASGLALLKLDKLKTAPIAVADTFDGGPVQCMALTTVELFRPDASVIEGQAPRPGAKWVVRMIANPVMPGAPLLSGGKIVGVTFASHDTEPGAVNAVTFKPLKELLKANPRPAIAFTKDPKQAIFQVTATHGR